MSRLGRFLLETFDPPELIYRVTFADGLPDINPNWLNSETTLLCGATSWPDQDHDPPTGPVGILAGGLVLSITRPADAQMGLRVVHCSTAMSPHLRRFRLRAEGKLGTGQGAFDPQGAGSQWAPGVTAHNGSTDDLTMTGFKLHGATLQVRAGPEIGLGAANGTDINPAFNGIPAGQAYPGSSERTFVLGTDINCHDGTGTSRLTTPGYVWPPRRWKHKFNAFGGYFLQRAGVGLGIASGAGRATATFTKFEVWEWTRKPPWWRKFVVAVLGE